MTTSGTASIHTAIAAINPDPGDEIIDKAGMPIVDLTDDLKSHLHQPV